MPSPAIVSVRSSSLASPFTPSKTKKATVSIDPFVLSKFLSHRSSDNPTPYISNHKARESVPASETGIKQIQSLSKQLSPKNGSCYSNPHNTTHERVDNHYIQTFGRDQISGEGSPTFLQFQSLEPQPAFASPHHRDSAGNA